jgi:mannose-6-phosphate isomerase-like protein (cupin superfamily)
MDLMKSWMSTDKDPNLGFEIQEEEQRPWGYYQVLCDESDCKVKRITVFPRKRLSLQKHHHRDEHWYIIKGEATVTVGDREISLKTGQSVDIPREASHRIRNDAGEDVVFVEVQTGSYFGEDDIERIEDDYGRV